MRKKWISLLAVALMLVLAGGDLAEAKRSRSKRTSKRTVVARKGSRVKGGRGRAAKVSRARGGRRGRGRLARGRRRRVYMPQASASDLPRQPSTSIPSERVSEIQEALIKLGYLEGPASGQYDDSTINALRQFQADNKLPETGQPSAHTLKRLGVRKGSNDGYAVPVGRVSEQGKKPQPQNP